MRNNKLILFFLFSGLLILNSCKDLEKEMSVSTGTVTNILTMSADASGHIIDMGNGVTQHGHCYAKSPNATIDSSNTQLGVPSETGDFLSTLTNLEPGTHYYIKAYLSNGTETVYGSEKVFITVTASLPALSTASVTSITSATVVSGGNITSDGGAPVTARGVCWKESSTPTIADNKTSDGTGTGLFVSNVSGLSPGKGYHIRAYATNFAGTSYGNDLIFTSSTTPPMLNTTLISAITSTSASAGGTITGEGGLWITGCGVCWSTSANPTVNDNTTSDWSGNLSFTSSMTGLIPNTFYHVRAYAINNTGTAYGKEMIFKTFTGELTDFDGNTYNTITIGTQVWMRENLKVSHYRNGDVILNETNGTAWVDLTDGAYCWYNNDVANKAVYGALYNFYAVNSSKNLCPAGWHVATDGEWNTLVNYLGPSNIAGGMLKDTLLWNSPNSGGDNSSGFTALPGGSRGWSDGRFEGLGINGFWWTGSWNPPYDPSVSLLWYNSAQINIYGNPKKDGFSVRCLKDN
jgi:uncharacterized protein (TIGR02145 family)